jgi:hypothetical protein
MLLLLKNSKLTKTDLKEVLAEEYAHYYTEYKFEIIQILTIQGKNKIVKQLIAKTSTLTNIIMSDDYYATNLDLWLLAKHYDLPLIFFSGTELVENAEKFLIAHTSANDDYKDKYHFIRSPGIKHDVPNVFRLIATPIYNELIPLTTLKKGFGAKIIANRVGQNTLVDYFEKVGVLEVTIRLKEKKLKLTVEEPVEKVKKGRTVKKKLVLTE